MTEKQIAKKASSALEAIGDVPEGGYMIGINQTDLALPEYRLTQGLSSAVQSGLVQAGMFYSEQLAQTRKELRCVVLMIRKTRTLWGQELGAPVCSSDDGIRARVGALYEGRECQSCPHRSDAPWLLSEDERRKACLGGYSLLCVDREINKPFLFRVAGTAVTAIRSYLTAIETTYGGVPFLVETTFTSEQRQKKYTYYALLPKIVGTLDVSEVLEYKAIADELLSKEIQWSGAGADQKVPDAPPMPPTAPAWVKKQAVAEDEEDDDALF